MTFEPLRCGAFWLVLALPLGAVGQGAEPDRAGFFSTNVQARLAEALACLNMTGTDMGFDKDHGEPRLALPAVRRILNDPGSAVRLAQEAWQAAESGSALILLDTIGGWLDAAPSRVPAQDPEAAPFVLPGKEELAPELLDAVRACCLRLGAARALTRQAFSALDRSDRERLAARWLSGLLEAEDKKPAFRALTDAGIPEDVLQAVIEENRELDAAPYSAAFLDGVERIDRGRLIAAARVTLDAADKLAAAVESVGTWPRVPLRLDTPYGPVRIGTAGDDRHTGAALLILDPAGNDTYGGEAGVANGLLSCPVAVLVDCAGDDAYRGEGLCGPGTGLFGTARVLDRGGDDRYVSAWLGGAAGVFGAGWVEDRAGRDFYEAYALAQGAAVAGFGVLDDRDGNDIYRAGLDAQGYAAVAGIGWLTDRSGNDLYYAGGRHPDYERHEDRYLSLSQGCAVGARPAGGGGIGVLSDLAGNDTYGADVYGQGVGYWYAAGLLLDGGGHDSYEVFKYGQGSGIHLSCGLLHDRSGNDAYLAASLSQGSGHDFGVGILLDDAGRDRYTAGGDSQAGAINNSFALLADGAGDDAYFARNPGSSQGAGGYSEDRGCGSLALLLDLAGQDRYSCGATNGARLSRAEYGIVFDAADAAEEASAGEGGGADAAPETIEWEGQLLDPAGLSLDDLMFHASRYANTPVRARNKRTAREALHERGAVALRYLVERTNMENIWFFLYARQMVNRLPDPDAAEVLLEFIHVGDDDVRKAAVFLLGYCDTPDHAEAVVPLLDDDTCAGAAVRTLGKWRHAASVQRIAAYLADPEERRRVVAARALGDIGDAAACAALIGALGDPVFTVRNTAADALADLPPDAACEALLAALPDGAGAARRQIVRTLGVVRCEAAADALAALLDDPDPAVRGDAARALRAVTGREVE